MADISTVTDDTGEIQESEEQVDQGSDILSEYSQSQYDPFLNTIKEEHREVVGPYLKNWDANATRRFTELSQRYGETEKLLQELGDPQQLQQAVQIFQGLSEEESARQIYAALHEMYGEPQQEYYGEEEGEEEEDPYEGLPPQLLERLDRYDQNNQLVEMLAEFVLGENQHRQAQQEDAALDDVLSQMKTEYGDFDEDYVLIKMEQGATPDQAIQAYNRLVQSQVTQAMKRQNVPVPLSSGSPPVAEDVPITKAGRKDVQALIAEVLNQNNAVQQ